MAPLKFYVKVNNCATLRFNAFPASEMGEIPMNSRKVDLKIIKNELTELIARGMPCLAEFGEYRLVTGSIEELSIVDNYMVLRCCFNGVDLKSKKQFQAAGCK
jgi:hypothetical protein